MKKIMLTALAFGLSASSADATGDVYCHSADGSNAEFGYGFGRVPGLAIISATIRANGQIWSLPHTDGALPMILAQGAHDGPRTIIDFADPEFSEIIASVRMISAVEGDEYRSVGVLRIPKIGVFAMICE